MVRIADTECEVTNSRGVSAPNTVTLSVTLSLSRVALGNSFHISGLPRLVQQMKRSG